MENEEEMCDHIFHSNRQIEPLDQILDNKDLEFVLDTTPVEPNIYPSHFSQPSKNIEPIINEKTIVSLKVPEKQIQGNDRTKIVKITETSSHQKQKENKCSENDSSYHVSVRLKENLILKYTRSDMITKQKWADSIRKIYFSPQPFTRHAWMKYSEINIKKSAYPTQYLNYNGEKLMLFGSHGGDCKSFNYNPKVKPRKIRRMLTRDKIENTFKRPPDFIVNNYNIPKKKRLLTSWNVSFKPGPLSKKSSLKNTDMSLGVELVTLPRVALEVYPEIGIAMDSTARTYLTNVRHSDGFIDSQWAEYSTSVLDKKKSNNQIRNSYTFPIPYENNQCRILCQHTEPLDKLRPPKSSYLDQVQSLDVPDSEPLLYIDIFIPSDYVEKTVKDVLTDLLTSVHISEMQNRYWKYDDDYNPVENDSEKPPIKKPRTKYSELKKLDVTIIDIDEKKEPCNKNFCKLGCVCESLQKNYMFKQHCGQQRCMFHCDCYIENEHDIFNSDVTNSTIYYSTQNQNFHLSKEQQKFRRTVIASDQQTIMIGARRRGSHIPKKYEDFVDAPLDDQQNLRKIQLSLKNYKVILDRLPSYLPKMNVWCMVHQLYNCFCKGQSSKGDKFNLSYDEAVSISTSMETYTKCFTSTKSNQSSTHLTSNSPKEHELNHSIDEPASVSAPVETDTKCVTSTNCNQSLVNCSPSTEKCDSHPMIENHIIDELLIPNNEKKIDAEIPKSSRTSARTTHFPNFVIRSRKCIMKYKERNSRIVRLEQLSSSNIKRLEELIEASAKNISENSTLKRVKSTPRASPENNSILKRKYKTRKGATNGKNIESNETTKAHNNKGDINTPNFSKHNKKDMPVVDNYLTNVVKEAIKEGYKMASVLIQPRKEHIFLYSWKECVRNYVYKKNFIYIKKGKPYNIFLYMDRDIVPVSNDFIYLKSTVSKELLSLYPPILTQIVRENETAFDGVILIGRTNCWEVGGILEKSAKKDNENTQEKLSDKKIVTKKQSCINKDKIQPEEKQLSDNQHNEIFSSGQEDTQIIRINEENPYLLKYGHVLPKPIILNNGNFRIPTEFNSNKVRYVKLSIQNDFSSLCVPHRFFVAQAEQINNMIQTAQSTQLSVKLTSVKDCTDRKGCLKNFAMYAVPCFGNSVVLGPYEINEKMGIIVWNANKSNIKYEKSTTGIWMCHNDIASQRLNQSTPHSMNSTENKTTLGTFNIFLAKKIDFPMVNNNILHLKNGSALNKKVIPANIVPSNVISSGGSSSSTSTPTCVLPEMKYPMKNTVKIRGLKFKVLSLLQQNKVSGKILQAKSTTDNSNESSTKSVPNNNVELSSKSLLAQGPKSPPPQCSQSPSPKCTKSPVPQLIRIPPPQLSKTLLSHLIRSPPPQCLKSSLPQSSISQPPQLIKNPPPQLIRSPPPQCSKSSLPQSSINQLPLLIKNPAPQLIRSPPSQISESPSPQCSSSKSVPSQCSKRPSLLLSNRQPPQISKSNEALPPKSPPPENENDSDDDVVFLPTKNTIVEISDTEEDEDKPGWFMCLNIPNIGYIPVIEHGNGSIEFQLSNFGIMRCRNKMDAMKEINLILKKYVGFENEDLICEWKMTTKFSDLKNISQFDNHKLNRHHVITKDGFKKKKIGVKRFVIQNQNDISCKLVLNDRE